MTTTSALAIPTRPETSRTELGDRALGAMLGLAVGDALGCTLEFEERDAHPLLTEVVGGGAFNMPPGCWTDDTSMALCLSDTLVRCGRVDHRHFLNRLTAWWLGGENSPVGYRVDVGRTVDAALNRYQRTAGEESASAKPDTAGNGSLVRVAPVVLLHHRSREQARAAAQAQSLATHAAPECLDACAYLADVLVEALNGRDRDEVLRPLPWQGASTVEAIAAGSWRSKSRAEIKSTGYVIDTLEAALWAVGGATDFEDALVRAVNLADDADSVGAVTGQLAGAIWGADSIPGRWLEPLAWTRTLHTRSEQLLARLD